MNSDDTSTSMYTPLSYIVASTDTTSINRLAAFDQNTANSSKLRLPKHDATYTIPRAREVGQSYFTSIFTTLYSILYTPCRLNAGQHIPVCTMKRSLDTSRSAPTSENTATGAAFAEAIQESGVALPQAVLDRLRTSIMSRVACATPHLLTSSRTNCPSISGSRE